ncbi:GMC oxidoreductase [Periconia macrospinosa]|uniref:GMC oxidoreductase n=1 Tax=Periconia macrospinosa TaxID=97972 RepID=A0A2V1DT82_9PLEO|nr:GMC oxidoreductase [Periconia macrospinosa]
MYSLLFGAAALLFSDALAQSNEYEYVIIGSGAGGGPLAANLARAGHSVYLIEAGENRGDDLLQRVPSFANEGSEEPRATWSFFVSHYENETQAYRDTKYTWRTPEQDYYVGLDPPEGSEPLGIYYPRGASLGGSSMVNAMNFALPPDRDWDAIADLTGDETWRATSMRTYYERLEHSNYIASNGTGSQGHGFDGYIHSNHNDVELLRGQPGFLEIIRTLYNSVGHFPNSTDEIFQLMQRDMNRLDDTRYEANDLFNIPIHYDAQHRRSSAQSYLMDTVNQYNADGTHRYPLTINTNSLATRIIFENSTTGGKPRAVGVEYLHGQALYRADQRHNGLQRGTPGNVTATREVIVSGGAFNTPQILKLSGVGPADELTQHGISVVVDLPAVGTNLQDNYEGGVHVEAARPFESVFMNCTWRAPGDPCLRQWEADGSGAYGIGAAPVSALYRTSVAETPDADLFLFGAAGALFEGFFPGYGTNYTPPETFFWSVVKMQMRNTAGTVKLRSADPQDTPEIAFNFFAEGREKDLQSLVEGVQWTLDAFESIGAPYGPYRVVKPVPGVDMGQSIMDDTFSHHASSTCAIGVNQTTSCVDSQFRVHGVDGLRVVDASVFPSVPGAFPVLPTFMISEKAFAVILEGLALNATARV